MDMEAREKAANSSTQLPTIVALPSATSPSMRHENKLLRNIPFNAQITSSVAAPNTQRMNTTFSGVCCDDTTSQPTVPDISIATVISTQPTRVSLELIASPFKGGQSYRSSKFS